MLAPLLLVGNPTAQSGRNHERIERARSLFQRTGVACEFLSTLPGGATVGAVQELVGQRRHRAVVAMGGDGTFREVAAGLLDSGRAEEVPLGMLPTGTANDQGRSFGLDAADGALEHNVGVIIAGREARLDAGRLEAIDAAGQTVVAAWFFDSAGWGLSARVLAVRNRDRESVAALPIVREIYRDQLVYAGALVRTFLESYVTSDKFTAWLFFDAGQRREELSGLTDLILKNTRVYGGGWIFDKSSLADDGLFEVVPFHGKRDWTSKAIVGLADGPISEEQLNEVGIRHSQSFRVADLELSFEVPEGTTPLAAQIDGEEFPATPRVRLHVVPRALRLIVP